MRSRLNPTIRHREREAVAAIERVPEIMLHESPALALKEMGRLLRESNPYPPIIFDVDDVTHHSFHSLVEAMNRRLVAENPLFPPVGLKELQENNYWLDGIGRLQEVAQSYGFKDFNTWFGMFTAKNIDVHATMAVNEVGLQLQNALAKRGSHTAAYVTARAQALAHITAVRLFTDGYAHAPVVCRDSDIEASDYKLRVFDQEVFPNLNKGKRVIFIDDSLRNIQAVCELGGGRVIGVIPEVPRNSARLAKLDRNTPFIYGDVTSIMGGLTRRGII